MGLQERTLHLGFISRLRVDTHIDDRAHELDVVYVNELIQQYQPFRGRCAHPMIRKDDEVGCLEQPALAKSLNESPKGSIDGYQGLIDLQRAGSIVVGGDIRLLEIQG